MTADAHLAPRRVSRKVATGLPPRKQTDRREGRIPQVQRTIAAPTLRPAGVTTTPHATYGPRRELLLEGADGLVDSTITEPHVSNIFIARGRVDATQCQYAFLPMILVRNPECRARIPLHDDNRRAVVNERCLDYQCRRRSNPQEMDQQLRSAAPIFRAGPLQLSVRSGNISFKLSSSPKRSRV
jgi:hypothetical protein